MANRFKSNLSHLLAGAGFWWGEGRGGVGVWVANRSKSNLSHLRAGAGLWWGEGQDGVGYGRATLSKVTYLIFGLGVVGDQRGGARIFDTIACEIKIKNCKLF